MISKFGDASLRRQISAATVAAAMDAAETGHLVISTLHTVNAARTLDRVLSFFPARQHSQVCMRLADNLAGIVSQRLVPRRNVSGLVPAIELLTSVPRVKEILVEGETVEVARMLAMKAATENADEMISHLTMTYNRARQTQITSELLEVISGAEALNA